MSFGSNIDLTAGMLNLFGYDLGSWVTSCTRFYLYRLRWTFDFVEALGGMGAAHKYVIPVGEK